MMTKLIDGCAYDESIGPNVELDQIQGISSLSLFILTSLNGMGGEVGTPPSRLSILDRWVLEARKFGSEMICSDYIDL